jgi:hypothetical protein
MLAVSSQEMSVTIGSTVLAAYPPSYRMGQSPLLASQLMEDRTRVGSAPAAAIARAGR